MPALLPNDWEQLYPRHTPDRFTPEDGSRLSCCNIALYFCIYRIKYSEIRSVLKNFIHHHQNPTELWHTFTYIPPDTPI